jgi:hypothetical protein
LLAILAEISTEYMKMMAVAALTRPRIAKAGNSRKEAIWCSGTTKAGKSPNQMRLTMVPVTEEMTIAVKAVME